MYRYLELGRNKKYNNVQTKEWSEYNKAKRAESNVNKDTKDVKSKGMKLQNISK